VPIAVDTDDDDDHLTLPISTGVHPAVDVEPALPAVSDVLPVQSDPAIAIAEADAASGGAAYPEGDPAAEDAASDRGEPGAPRNVHERLRGLPLAAQIKVAATGELHERTVVERLYGKTVWETLLRNPRLTPPEVSRIARYGSLPRVLLDIILASNAWLAVPEVRRALLSNPRLPTDQIMKILRLVPRHELRLAANQTTYPQAVRSAARVLLGGE
jgi:hypothetical protein